MISEGEECPKCGGQLKLIGKEIVRTEVEFIQAKLIVKQIMRQVDKCENCFYGSAINFVSLEINGFFLRMN